MAVYAPTNDASEDDKDKFYEQPQKVIDKIPHTILLVGNWKQARMKRVK